MSATLRGQSFGYNSLHNLIEKNSGYYREKVFVHTDRTFYLCGEVLWFKVYLSQDGVNTFSHLSKIVYVEILNNLSRSVLQAKISINDGVGNGSFYLPFSLISGNYQLRAYSNWMKNFPHRWFFHETLSIINTNQPIDTLAEISKPIFKIGFFPEGGDLVNGIRSEVAFKCIDNAGNGFGCSGWILDQNQDTLTHFTSFKFGMGHFYLTPHRGLLYSAVVLLPNGETIVKSLPKSHDSGYVIHLSEQNKGNVIHVYCRWKGFKNIQDSGFIVLLIHSGGRAEWVGHSPLKSGQVTFNINLDNLESGISEFTLLNSDFLPVCERLFFKIPGKVMKITIKTDRHQYGLRSMVNLSIQTSNDLGSPLSGNFSLAIFRLDSFNQINPKNIINYLWLGSELRGRIESPGYYFSSNNDRKVMVALDNLLLTQGWRRFPTTFKFNSRSNSFNYPPEYSGQIITGKVFNNDPETPIPGALVYLSVPGKRIQLYGSISDSLGDFHFDLTNFYGFNQIVLRIADQKNLNYQFQINSPFSNDSLQSILPTFKFNPEFLPVLQKNYFMMEVSNAYHGSKLHKFFPQDIDSTPFFGKPDNIYLLDNYVRYTTMEEVLREYVSEVNVRKRDGQFVLLTENEPGIYLSRWQSEISIFDKDPLILLDGIPIFDVNKLMAFDPLKIQKLEIVSKKYYWGPIKANGIISFSTYKGDLEGYQLNSKALLLKYEGLQDQRIFYNPSYISQKEKSSSIPDFRNLLYWNPEVLIKATGKVNFTFYTGDLPGKYLVMLQGLSNEGIPGSQTSTFIVNR